MFREHAEAVPPHLEAEKARLEAEGKTVLLVHRELSREQGVGVHEPDGGWLGLVRQVACTFSGRRTAKSFVSATQHAVASGFARGRTSVA